jgi:hypothetical protein
MDYYPETSLSLQTACVSSSTGVAGPIASEPGMTATVLNIRKTSLRVASVVYNDLKISTSSMEKSSSTLVPHSLK